MSAYNDTHDLEVQDEKPDNLPGPKLSPEPCGCSRVRGICDLFRAARKVFVLHNSYFQDVQTVGLKQQVNFIRELKTRTALLLPYI